MSHTGLHFLFVRRPWPSSNSSLVRLACAAASLLLISPVAGANLLQNADFELHDNLFQLHAWNLTPSADDQAATPTLRPSASGEVVLQLDADPTGNNWTAPALMAGQNLAPLPGIPSPRVIFSVQIARDPADPGDSSPVLFALQLNTPGGPMLAPIQLDTAAIPADGNFHTVAGRSPVPPANQDGAVFVIFKTGPGRFYVDGLTLDLVPQTIQVNPPVGAASGGFPVQLANPQIGPTANVFFGDNPAPILNPTPGGVVVMCPPGPPGAVDVRVMLGPGNTLVEPLGFIYVPPLGLTGFSPTDVSSLGGTPIVIQGSGFGPGVSITIDGAPTSAPLQINSPDTAILIVPPLPPGPHTLGVFDGQNQVELQDVVLFSIAPPAVESVTPAAGPAEGGTEITIQGANFMPGATVRIGDTDATGVMFVSPTELQVTTSTNDPGLFDVTVTNPNGISSSLVESFQVTDVLRGDINGDDTLDLTDVALSLQLATGQTPTGNLNLAADVDGDGTLGLAEGLYVLEATEFYDLDSFTSVAQPKLSLQTPRVTHGAPALVMVTDLSFFHPATINWGDGFATQLSDDGVYDHIYDGPGTFAVRLDCGAGVLGPVEVEINSAQTLNSTTLSMTGTDLNGAPITGFSVQIDPAQPPVVTLQITAEGTGIVSGTLLFDAPTNPDTPVALTLEFNDPTPGSHTLSTNVPGLTYNEPGIYLISFNVDPGISTDVDANNPPSLAVNVQPTIEETWRELQQQWEQLRLDKAAKRKECEDLAKKIADLQAQLAQLMADQNALQTHATGCRRVLTTNKPISISSSITSTTSSATLA